MKSTIFLCTIAFFSWTHFSHVANVVEGIYTRKNCHVVNSEKCALVRQILASPDGWFKLSDKRKKEVTDFVGVGFLTFLYNFQKPSQRLTGLNPDKAKYDIYYAQPQSKGVPAKVWPAKIGHWTPRNGTEFQNQIQQVLAEIANITSACPTSCPPGTRQIATFAAYARSCCWQTCEPCTGRTYTNSSNSRECRKCEKGHKPNADHTECNVVFHTSKTDQSSSVAAIWFATIGFSMASLTLVVFYKHRDTFIVKAADYVLSMGMLIFHAFSFLSVALLLVKPSDTVCVSQVLFVLPLAGLIRGVHSRQDKPFACAFSSQLETFQLQSEAPTPEQQSPGNRCRVRRIRNGGFSSSFGQLLTRQNYKLYTSRTMQRRFAI